MAQDYTEKGIVKLDMQRYIQDMLEEFPEDLKGDTSQTPGADNVYRQDNSKRLGPTRAETFHTFVTK